MITERRTSAALWLAGTAGLAGAAYLAWVATAWHRYGRASPPRRDALDPLLDALMPEYDVVERHQVRVAAPPAATLAAAVEINIQESPLIRAIFTAREWVLGVTPSHQQRPTALLADMQSLGWRVLAEEPGHEIVVGAVTQPWLPRVVFRGLPPDEFRSFREAGYVKIAWTLRADPAGPGESIFRTETRVVTTDSMARRRFRWYWARFSPGIVLIRRVMLRRLRQAAEHRERLGMPV